VRPFLAAFLFALAACAQGDGVPAPVPGSVSDPDLAALIDSASAKVRAAREDADAWAGLAMVYDANAFYTLAEPCYRRAVELRPSEAKWWYGLAYVLERRDRYDEAVAAAKRASELAPDYAPIPRTMALWALARGRLDEAETAAERALNLSGGGAGSWIVVARIHMEHGHDADAVEALRHAIEGWPEDWGKPSYAHFLLGNALARLGRSEEAARHFALGRGKPPQLPDPWRGEVVDFREGFASRLVRAHQLVLRDEHEAAIAALLKLRETNPRHEQVLTDLGTAYLLTGRWTDAIEALKACVDAHPNSLDPQLQLARGLWAAGRRDEAVRQAEAAVAANPTAGDAFETRGWLLLRNGRPEPSLADFETAARLDPTNASALSLAGAANLVLDRDADAEAAFRRALALDAGQTTAIAGLAIVEIRRRDLAAADAHLAKIARLRDDAAPLVAEARKQRMLAER
jgi:protein O-GlcNAc transferase